MGQHPSLPSSSLVPPPRGTVYTHGHPSDQLWPPSPGGPYGARGLWAGAVSPRLRMHLGKEGVQESMEPVLWPRLGARVQGALGPTPVLTWKVTFRAAPRPPLLCSLSLQSIWGMGRGGWHGMVCMPLRGNMKKWVLPLPALTPGTSNTRGKLLFPIFQKGMGSPNEG